MPFPEDINEFRVAASTHAPYVRFILLVILDHIERGIWETDQGIPEEESERLNSSVFEAFDRVIRSKSVIIQDVNDLVNSWDSFVRARLGA